MGVLDSWIGITDQDKGLLKILVHVLPFKGNLLQSFSDPKVRRSLWGFNV